MRYLAAFTALALPYPALATEPLRVLSTIGMLSDMVQAIGGECVAAEALMGPGSDPHLYTPRASDIGRLDQAEVILYLDPALEAQMTRPLEAMRGRKPVLGVLAATYAPEDLLDDDGQPDPHVWMAAGLWAQAIPQVSQLLSEARPDCAEAMAQNAAEYSAQLEALDDWARLAIDSIPEETRLLVTAHDAFNYFSRAYEIEASEAVAGISTDAEPSIADIREVAAFVVEHGVPAVFVETTINPRSIEALVAEVRAQGHEVVIGGELFADAMGEPGQLGEDYIGMIWSNIATITSALGGTLPPVPEALADWAEQALR